MSLRHTAALALVGWYLIAPPYHQGGQWSMRAPLSQWQLIKAFDMRAPLSQWQIVKAFDTASDCEAERKFFIKSVKDDQKQKGQVFNYIDRDSGKTISSGSSLFHCVSSDDPRLKEK